MSDTPHEKTRTEVEDMASDREHPRRPRKYWWLIIACGTLLVLAGIYVAYRRNLKSQIKTKLNELRQAGYPTTLAELDEWYAHIPDDENAALLYQEALSLCVEPSEDEAKHLPVLGSAPLPPRGQPLPEDMTRHIAEYLEKNKDALELLHQAAAMEKCRFPVNFEAEPGTLLPHFSRLRQGAGMLHLEALRAAEDGNVETATRAILSCVGLARSLRDEPLLMSQLMRMALEVGYLRVLDRVLSRIKLGDTDLTRIHASLDDAVNSRTIHRGGLGQISWFSEHYTERLSSAQPAGWRLWWYRLNGQRDVDCIYCFDIVEELIEAQELSFPERLEKTQEIQDRLNDLPRTRFLAGAFRPPMLRATVEEARAIARLRATIAALGVERFRLANGRLPDKLSDLVPKYLDAVPLDPFDGKPLRYKKLKKGFRVYSIGKDKKDDGGVEKDFPPSGNITFSRDEPADITFTIERGGERQMANDE